MKKFLRTIFVIVIALMSVVTTAFASSKLESGEEPFYVRSEQNKIYWGGGFSVNEKLSEDLYSLFVAFYDNGRLVSVDNVTVDENLKSYTFSEQSLIVETGPQNLSATAFAWSMDGKMTPLSKEVGAEIKNDVSDSTADNTEEDFALNILENNINLINQNGNVYVAGALGIEAQGNALYDMNIKVEDGSSVIYSDTIKLDSKMKLFSVNQKLDTQASDSLVMTVEFSNNSIALTEPVSKNISHFTSAIVDEVIINQDEVKIYIDYQNTQ